MSEFIPNKQGMICGSHDAEIRKYRKHIDPEGNVWLVASQENSAENIYVHFPKVKDSQGFAGRTITFELEDGSFYEAQGPWKTESNALFKATGIDVRDKYLTYVCLSKEMDFTKERYPRTIYRDVVYCDTEPVLGPLKRYEALAEKFPEANYFYMECKSMSTGGAIRPLYPKKENAPEPVSVAPPF